MDFLFQFLFIYLFSFFCISKKRRKKNTKWCSRDRPEAKDAPNKKWEPGEWLSGERAAGSFSNTCIHFDKFFSSKLLQKLITSQRRAPSWSKFSNRITILVAIDLEFLDTVLRLQWKFIYLFCIRNSEFYCAIDLDGELIDQQQRSRQMEYYSRLASSWVFIVIFIYKYNDGQIIDAHTDIFILISIQEAFHI